MAIIARSRPAAATCVVDIDDDVPTDPRERRNEAVRSAVDGACRGGPDSRAPSVALRRYAPGCVAVAVAGRPGTAEVEHLRALCREVDRLATEELVVDCSHLVECGPGVARTLAGLRVRRLSAGARVELHDPPSALRAAVGPNPASEYVVDDAPPTSRRARSGRAGRGYRR